MGLKPLDVVAIDGPAGAGKSTIARRVSLEIGFGFLDTGAMYRAVALHAVRTSVKQNDKEALQLMLKTMDMHLAFSDSEMKITVDGTDFTRLIREPEVGQYASDYSTVGIVREFCSARQREIGERGGVVAEGRDMGTVVFPDARWKFFVTASVEERARRRLQDLYCMGETVTLEDVLQKIEMRDHQDSNRDLAPLKPAVDAIIVDTTTLKIEEVVAAITSKIEKKV